MNKSGEKRFDDDLFHEDQSLELRKPHKSQSFLCKLPKHIRLACFQITKNKGIPSICSKINLNHHLKPFTEPLSSWKNIFFSWEIFTDTNTNESLVKLAPLDEWHLSVHKNSLSWSSEVFGHCVKGVLLNFHYVFAYIWVEQWRQWIPAGED